MEQPAGEADSADLRPVADLIRSGSDPGAAAGPISPLTVDTAGGQPQLIRATDAGPVCLGHEATLYAFSTLHVPGRNRGSDGLPYTLGYVDFANGERILAELRGPRFVCGQRVRVVADDADETIDAVEVAWWVEPVPPGGSA